MRRWRRLRRVSRLLAVVLAAASVTASLAGAVESPGSKNFSTPRYVPNYFSNESSPFNGARPSPGSLPSYAAPAPRAPAGPVVSSRRYAGHYVGRGRGRARFAHLRGGGRRQLAYVRVAGRVAARSLHVRSGARGKAVPVHSRAIAGKRLAHAGR